MKKIFIILILFLFSCEEADVGGGIFGLEEQTAPLSGMFYVFEGWNEFMAQDYDRAKELFSATLYSNALLLLYQMMLYNPLQSHNEYS